MFFFNNLDLNLIILIDKGKIKVDQNEGGIIVKITKDMLIGDIIRTYPESINILMQNGLGCVGCPASQMESLEEAAMVHGLDVNNLLEQLNQ